MDEIEYAQAFGGFFQELEQRASIPKLKLMLDGLKEWARHLEPKRSSLTSADMEEPVVVQLLHSVDRPHRQDAPEAMEEAIGP